LKTSRYRETRDRGKFLSTRQISVLLIEDNPGDALLMRRYLSDVSKVHYEVNHVDYLSKGLDCLKSDSFSVVLLDLNLPDATGLGIIDQICRQAPDIPIIVLTGHDDDELGVEAVQKGAQDYLVKGHVTGSLLGRSIRYAIERKKLLVQLEHSAKEIKTLRGFLPICANCKKIRDDKGYWTQIETYISAQTQAEFTHGICPECANKLYGKFLDKKE
jgi:DNA-binding NtrC family response regulator